MPLHSKKITIPKFPLRLMPSVRRNAELFSEKEGVSLNQFINLAVAEKLAHLEHDEWIRSRPTLQPGMISNALRVLDNNDNPPVSGDDLPDGYTSVRGDYANVRQA
jgi:hypothetical protein